MRHNRISASVTRAMNSERRALPTNKRPGLLTEVHTFDGMCLTGRLWYAGRVITRDEAYQLISDARAENLSGANVNGIYDNELIIATDSGNLAIKFIAVKRLVKVG
jgi:hypothetical protein